MMTTKKTKGTAVSIPAGVTIGVCVSLSITLILAAMLTWIVSKGKVDENVVGYISVGILLFSAILGTLTSSVKIKRRRMLVCCETGALYFASLLAITAIFFGGNFRGIGVTAIVILIGSLIPGVLGGVTRNRDNRRYRKYGTG